MKTLQKTWKYLFVMFFSIFLMVNTTLPALVSKGAQKDFHKYFEEAPWIGLIANEISYGPIKVSKVNIHEGNKVVIAAPEEVLEGSLRYRIDAEDLKLLHRYHLIVGIKNEGAQDCVTHCMGVWNSKGKGTFSLTAPKKPGIYEVRFLFVDALTCHDAQSLWSNGAEEPTAKATIGIIIVE